MLGLLVIAVLLVYLVISVFVIKCSVVFVRRYFGHGWIGGVLAALVMYNLVFWDAIPIWYTHYSLCATEAGLTVYKTPEEWVKANPERYRKARESPKRIIEKTSDDDLDFLRYKVEYSSGLMWESYRSRRRDYAFNTGVEGRRLVDVVKGGVLFEVVDFYAGAGTKSLSIGAESFADYKFWTVTGSCQHAYPGMKDNFTYHGREFYNLIKTMEGWDIL